MATKNWGKLFCARDYIADGLWSAALQAGCKTSDLKVVKDHDDYKQWEMTCPETGAKIRVRVDLVVSGTTKASSLDQDGRVNYKCSRCGRRWTAMSPRAARLATGRPVHCNCGEIATYVSEASNG